TGTGRITDGHASAARMPDRRRAPAGVHTTATQGEQMPLNIYSSSDHDNMQKLPFTPGGGRGVIQTLKCGS
ncbi:hypothetical protein D6F66_21325, partial [Salmonella enterica]|nr:hypothetical protein [Salmonella enterica]